MMGMHLRLAPGLGLTLILMLSACGGGGSGDGDASDSGGGADSPALPSNPLDNTPPSIVSRSPAPDATGVDLSSNVSVTFNEAMQALTINSVNFKVIDPAWGLPISGVIGYDPGSYTATFNPYSDLTEYTTYTVVLQNVTDEALNPLPDTSWQFRTADITAPSTTASPTGGHYNTAQSVSLSCDDGAGSGCTATYYTTDGSTPNSGSNLYTAPIDFAAPPNTEQTIALRFYSVDAEGNAEAVRGETYVMDTLPPEITAVSPLDGAADVVLTDALTVTFSEPILQSTLNTSSFILSAADHQIVGAITWDGSGSVATFTADAPLECNTVYTASVSTAVTDLADNALVAPYTWSFTTNADCTAPRTSISPYGGVIRAATQTVTLACTDPGAPSSGCKRLVYTTDGSVPSFDTGNGTVVDGAGASFEVAVGDTYVRVMSEDNAGNREAVQEVLFSLSDAGFTYVATEVGLARGVGPVPDSFINTLSMHAGNLNAEAVVSDPGNNRLYLLGGRLFFSDDGAKTWVMRDEAHGLANSSAYALAVRGSRVYAGGLNGLYVSTNGGASFEAGGYTGPIQHMFLLENRLFVSDSTTGLWVSSDRGHSFTKVLDKVIAAVDYFHVSSLAGAGDTLYVGTNAKGVFVSTDSGQSFNQRTVDDGLGSDHVRDLFLTAEGDLYVATDTWVDGSPGTGGLSKSTNGGVTFTNSTIGLPTNIDGKANLRSVAVDGSNVYVSSDFSSDRPDNASLSISRDAGTSFTETVTMYEGLAASAVADIDVVGGRIFAFTEGGLSVSDDDGASFSSLGLADNKIRALEADTSGMLYVGSGNDLFKRGGLSISTDGGQSFVSRGLADGLPSYIVNAIDVSADGNTLHVATDFMANDLLSGYAKSVDGGASFISPVANVVDPLWKARGPLAVDGVNVYIAAGYVVSYAFHVSNDEGASFTTTDTVGSIPDSRPSDVVVAADGTVYVGTNQGIAVSTDNGASFPTVLRTDNGLGADRIGVMFHDGSALYARTMGDFSVPGANGLAVSTDGGASFVMLTTANGLPSNQISTVASYPGHLYVGTDQGLAISTDSGSSFTIRTDADGLGYNRPTAVVYVP